MQVSHPKTAYFFVTWLMRGMAMIFLCACAKFDNHTIIQVDTICVFAFSLCPNGPTRYELVFDFGMSLDLALPSLLHPLIFKYTVMHVYILYHKMNADDLMI